MAERSAKAKVPARTAPAAAPPAPARRGVAWLLPIAGAAAATLWGLLVARMQAGASLVMMALGGAVVAACGVAIWRALDSLLTDGDEHVPQTQGRLRELQREKKTVLRALKEIDFDHRMRKLDDADHREMVERYRARALQLMAEIEDGDDVRGRIERDLHARLGTQNAAPTTATTTTTITTPRVCPGCSTNNDSDARFCKQCARPLG